MCGLLPSFVQGQKVSSSSIFGKGATSGCKDIPNIDRSLECEVFTYKRNFFLVLGRDREGKISVVSVYRKNDRLKSTLTVDDQRKLVAKISQLRGVGKSRLSGPFYYVQSLVKYSPKYDYWEFYENAFVNGKYSFFDNKKPRLISMVVMFTFLKNGTAEDVQEVTPDLELRKGGIPLIKVAGCSYFTFDRKLKVGMTGPFTVVNPPNDFGEKCSN